MRSTPRLRWLLASCLLSLCACAPVRPPQAPHSPVRAPAPDLLSPCPAMIADAAPTAAAALRADAANRGQYLACQAQLNRLIEAVRAYVKAGVLVP